MEEENGDEFRDEEEEIRPPRSQAGLFSRPVTSRPGGARRSDSRTTRDRASVLTRSWVIHFWTSARKPSWRFSGESHRETWA